MKVLNQSVMLLLMALLTGCTVNAIRPLTYNYKGKSPEEILTNKSYILSELPPLVKEGNVVENDLKELLRQGYHYVGSTFYVGSKLSHKKLQEFGSKYHAGYVINYVEYLKSVANIVPKPSYTGSSSGMAGAAAGHALSQMLVCAIHGTHTHYYGNMVCLFVKSKEEHIGLYLSDVQNSAGVKQKGAWVSVVQYNSVASRSGFREGDIILRINDIDVYDADHLTTIISNIYGTHDFYVFRHGSIITITVHVN